MTTQRARDEAARANVRITSEPRQLGLARLMELTPELYAHYADLPKVQAEDEKPETD